MSASREEGEEPVDEVDQYRMPLLDHLRELRTRLMMSVGAILVGFGVSLAFVTDILDFLTAPVEEALAASGIDGGLSIVNSPFEGMTVWMHTAFIGALLLASPVIAYQLWAFIAPGLYQTERKLVIPLAFSSTVLFLAGGAFAYYVLFPKAFPLFFTIVKADVSLSIQGYLSAVLKMLIVFGTCFQLPVATFFLSRMGLIDHRDMLAAFRYSIVGIFIIAAILTPGTDLLSQALLAVPLTMLYVISIGIAWASTTKDRSTS